MNYEQKYKEAIVKLRELFNSAEDNNETLDLWFNDFANIFPELKESEDEKFLRYLIDCCKSTIESDDKGLELSMDTTKRLFAWLEKQSEHANFRNKIQIGDKVTRNRDGVLVNLSQLKRVAKKDEKQGEQKPAWSEEDATHYNRILKELNLQKEMPINASVIEEVKSDIIWFKSLRPQNRWKPSGEQITWLYRAADDATIDSRMKQILKELLSDLKKLREE